MSADLLPLGGGFAVVTVLAGLFVRAMVKQDFGAWRIVTHHEETIARQDDIIKAQGEEIRSLELKVTILEEKIARCYEEMEQEDGHHG